MSTFSTLVFLFSVGLISAGHLPLGLLSSPTAYSSGQLVSSGYSGLSSGYSGLSSGYSGLSSAFSGPSTGYSSLSSGYLGQSGLASGYSGSPVSTVYTQSAPVTKYVSSGAVYSAPTAHAVYHGPSTVQNVFEERARVVPGEEYVYKVRSAPKVHKEVVHAAQIVQRPKVLYSEVVAEPKVDRVTVVQQENPHIVNVQPQVHKESVVFVQPKTKQQIFIAQKRRDTVAKKVEYEQQKFATTHQDGHNAFLVGTNSRTAYAPVYGNEGYTQTGYASAPLTGSTYETTNFLPQTGSTYGSSSSSFLPSSGSSTYSTGGLSTVSGGFSGLNGGYSGSTGTIHNQYKPNGVIYTQNQSGLSSSSSSSLSGTKN